MSRRKIPTSAAMLSQPVNTAVPRNVRVKNYRGEVSERRIQPISLWFGSTAYHPKPQWVLTATDLDRKVVRDFALKDMTPL